MPIPSVAAPLEGARYQFRFFWLQALPMLYASPQRVDRVVMEHRGVDAVDDVVVYYCAPGLADAERHVRIDYFQLKFRVNLTASITSADLVDPSWTGTKDSMLVRFAQAWQDLRATEPEIRLTLVTNATWLPTDPLAPLVRDQKILAEDFFAASDRSKIGGVRTLWREKLSFLSDDEFGLFIRHLRLEPGALSQRDSEARLVDRCQLAGLVPPNLSENHSPYDDLAGRLLAQGRTSFTPTNLSDLVQREGLVRTASPFASTCAVRSFHHFAYVPEFDSALVVDLTDLFDGREPISADVWSSLLPKRLATAVGRLASLATPVQLAIDAHLSIGWYLGTLLGPKAGIPVRLRQKGLGRVDLWDVAVPAPDPEHGWRFTYETVGPGTDIAVAVSVTQDVAAEVRTHVSTIPTIGTLLTCDLTSRGPAAIRNGGHARWLADEFVREVRRLTTRQGAERVHLFAAAPVSLAFLVGQQSAAIGPVTVYEYDFGRTNTYRPGLAT